MGMNFWQILNVNIVRSCIASIRAKCKIVCYKGVHFHMARDAMVIANSDSIIHINRSHYPSNYHNPGIFFMKKKSRLVVSGRVSFGDGVKITVHEKGECKFDKCIINNHCDIGIKSNLFIGKETLIGDYCSIHDFDGHKILSDDGKFEEGISPIYIGNNVWIGERVTILKGVTIGDNSIIGAGTLVTKDVPEGALVVGNPLRILKRNVQWRE